MREASEYQAHNTWLQSMMQAKDTQLQEKQHTIEARDRQLQEKHRTIEARDRQIQENQHLLAANQHAIETKERELQQKKEQLQASEQLVAEFQQSLQQQDKTISDLRQTISNLEGEIGKLKHLASNAPPCNTEPVAQKDIGKMTCREEKKAPEAMMRGTAVVHGNTAYFRLGNSARIYSYETSLWREEWSTLPDNPNADCSLAVIDDNLTSVGGYSSDNTYVDGRGYTNILLSLVKEGNRMQWSTVFPPMPTPRSRTACITTEQALVVAGGYSGDYLNTVEVMDINMIQWTAVHPLPHKLSSLSGVALGDSLYLAGGTTGGLWSNSVTTCYFPDLWQPGHGTLFMSNAWKEISPLPVTRSTLALLGSQLVAIGGDFYPGIRTTDIYRYDFHTNSWHVVNQMNRRRSQCFAVTLAENHLMIVGGNTKGTIKTDSVEVLEEK